MGLDMYLNAHKMFNAFNHAEDKEKAMVKKVVELAGLPLTTLSSASPFLKVELTVMYWRKANAIHAWFVDNVQGGVDECQKAHVRREDLETLLEACEDALASKDTSVLPTKGGFFFGSTEYDEWYWEDMKHTIERLKHILDCPELQKGWDFEYQSSW